MKTYTLTQRIAAIFGAICLVILAPVVFAQTNISGVINTYGRVTALSTNSITLSNVTGASDIAAFATGQKVMVIQMKGATIDSNNTASFGAISNINNAGNWEVATISSRSGNTLSISSLTKSYTISGIVQAVHVPVYTNATINGALSATAWDSTARRGGILALEVTGILRVNADVSANQAGFFGGFASLDNMSNGGAPNPTTYTSGRTSGLASKGEGIARLSNARIFGRGPLGTGGGGGNLHNAGGGGGSNHTAGGNGGDGWNGAGSAPYAPGLGGRALASYQSSVSPRLFFGSGGGGGQANNTTIVADLVGTRGGRGGGIIYMKANRLITSGKRFITANGQNGGNDSGQQPVNEGAGGGGAGGSIYLDILTYTLTSSDSLIVRTNGGVGGNMTISTAHAGGGGGGTGIIIHNKLSTPAFARFSSAPGANGVDNNANQVSATSGSGSSNCGASCTVNDENSSFGNEFGPLPVTFLSLRAIKSENQAKIAFITATETDASHFVIEGSDNGDNYLPLGQVMACGTCNQRSHYQFNYEGYSVNSYKLYRIKQVDLDGKYTYFGPAALLDHSREENLQIVANKRDVATVELAMNMAEDMQAEVSWYGLDGRAISHERIEMRAGHALVTIPASIQGTTAMLRVSAMGQAGEASMAKMVR